MKERWVPCAQRKGLIATRTLEELLFDLDDLQRQGNGQTASISTFGLASFCGAKLGKLSSGFGATAEMPREW